MKRMTAKQYRNRTTRNKYSNHRVEIDGHTFDSKAEARYYKQLKLRKRAEDIKDFELQPRFRLQEGFNKDGKRYRPIDYVADFKIYHNDGSIEVVDVKGAPPTQVFRIKEKMFNKKYPHKLTLVKWCYKRKGFVEV